MRSVDGFGVRRAVREVAINSVLKHLHTGLHASASSWSARVDGAAEGMQSRVDHPVSRSIPVASASATTGCR